MIFFLNKFKINKLFLYIILSYFQFIEKSNDFKMYKFLYNFNYIFFISFTIKLKMKKKSFFFSFFLTEQNMTLEI